MFTGWMDGFALWFMSSKGTLSFKTIHTNPPFPFIKQHNLHIADTFGRLREAILSQIKDIL